MILVLLYLPPDSLYPRVHKMDCGELFATKDIRELLHRAKEINEELDEDVVVILEIPELFPSMGVLDSVEGILVGLVDSHHPFGQEPLRPPPGDD